MLRELMAIKDTPEIRFSDAPVAYPDAVAFMEARVQDIIDGRARECIWFLEHPPLYTAGTRANPADLVQPDRFPVYASQRGGEYTYHGPGQRVVYLMLDLRTRGRDVRCFVRQAENWVIQTLEDFNIQAHITPGRVGVWVPRTRQHALLVGMGTSRPELKFIDKDVKVRPGDLVSTSPASTLLPANLPVAVVQSLNSRAVPAPTALVQLIAPPDAIDWVQVSRR